MTAFLIRKGIPIPPTSARKYPFNAMQPGDSFAIPSDALAQVRRAARAWTERHTAVMVVRQGEDGLWSCWRAS